MFGDRGQRPWCVLLGALLAIASGGWLWGCELDSAFDHSQRMGGLPDEPAMELAWPAAPQQSRLRYLNTIRQGTPWLECAEHAIAAPKAVAVDDSGQRAFVSVAQGVVAIDLSAGRVEPFAPGVRRPHGLAVASTGIFIVDKETATVKVFDRSGAVVDEIGGSDLVDPQAIAVDHERARLYVTEVRAHKVSVWRLSGEHLFDLDRSVSPIPFPSGVAVGSTGLVYVTTLASSHHVQVYRRDGTLVRAFGPSGTYPGQFLRPKGIAIDSDDNVYVADALFGNIQVFDASDRLAIWIGKNGSGVGEFIVPGHMTVDARDRLWVPEFGNHRVQIFEYSSETKTDDGRQDFGGK